MELGGYISNKGEGINSCRSTVILTLNVVDSGLILCFHIKREKTAGG